MRMAGTHTARPGLLLASPRPPIRSAPPGGTAARNTTTMHPHDRPRPPPGRGAGGRDRSARPRRQQRAARSGRVARQEGGPGGGGGGGRRAEQPSRVAGEPPSRGGGGWAAGGARGGARSSSSRGGRWRARWLLLGSTRARTHSYSPYSTVVLLVLGVLLLYSRRSYSTKYWCTTCLLCLLPVVAARTSSSTS